MFSELKQSIVKEKVQGEFDLSTLDDYFYIKLKSYMKRLSENDYDKVESMLNTLLRKRQGKIIHLADSSKLTPDISRKLSIEEREFFNQIYEISTKFSKKIVGDKK
jgi:DNA replication factor GINS